MSQGSGDKSERGIPLPVNHRTEKRTNWFLFSVIASLIIVSYDSYWFGTSGIGIFLLFRNLFVVGLPFLLLLHNPHVKILQTNIWTVLILMVCVQIAVVINNNTYGAPILIFSSVFTSLILIARYRFYEIAKYFSKTILLITIYSLIIVIGILIGIIQLKENTNVAGSTVLSAYGCLFFMQEEMGDGIIRNAGIFREPGVFMILINYSIIFELFILKSKYKWRRVVILSLGMVSLLSTGGLVCLCLIIFTYFISNKNGVVNIIILSLLIIGIVFPLLEDEITEMIFGKFNNINEYGSGFARWSSFIIPLNIFFEYPLFGCGFNQFEEEYVKVGKEIFHRFVDPQGMSTNTIMNIFAIWGGIFGSVIMYGLYKFSQMTAARRGKMTEILIFISILLMFSNESMPYFPFLYIFIFYGLSYSYYRGKRLEHG